VKTSIAIAEHGYAPDFLTRMGIKHLLRSRLRQIKHHTQKREEIISSMSNGPLAINTELANDQHYEVPHEFFRLMLGRSLKYSCAYFDNGAPDLDAAEEEMISITCDRAELEDGMKVLELGCGWGSLSLAMAKRYQTSEIVAVSNSQEQRKFILAQASNFDLKNLKVLTCDMNRFSINEKFDRVVSIEMFEHMRNYRLLFHRISSWLEPEGKLFFHIFCHRNEPYFFTTGTDDDWMAKHFFTGGVMPSYDLPLAFTNDLTPITRWQVNGTNYARTCAAWLANLDTRSEEAIDILRSTEDSESARIRFNRWRMFVMACQELFAFNHGIEWFVGHFLFAPTTEEKS